jgi:hypothetical protein
VVAGRWERPRTRRRPAAFLGDQTDGQGEAHQAGDVMHVEAVHQFHAVVLHRLGADLQHFGDRLRVPAPGDQLQNLTLSAGQLFERALLVAAAVARELPDQPVG